MGFNQQQRSRLGAWEINSTNTRELKTTQRNTHSPCARTQNGVIFEARGNSFMDETAKQAALTPEVQSSVLLHIFLLLPLPLSLPLLRNNK
jgi:hypothetical protein